MLCVGYTRLCVGYARLFKYQHVGIGNAKSSHWGIRMFMSSTLGCFLYFNLYLQIVGIKLVPYTSYSKTIDFSLPNLIGQNV